MKNNSTFFLKNLALPIKILLLLVVAAALFGSNLLVKPQNLDIYFIGLTVIVILLVLCGRPIVGKKTLKNLIIFWGIGIGIYALFAIPRIYGGGILTPYFTLTNIYERWFYSLLFPVILLGTFVTGLIFMKITSPIEFLRWGNFGFKLALLFRAFQHSIQILQDTKTALLMRGEWPEENREVSWRKTWLFIKYSPRLICTSLRNIILFWFPWGWLCVVKLQRKISTPRALKDAKFRDRH